MAECRYPGPICTELAGEYPANPAHNPPYSVLEDPGPVGLNTGSSAGPRLTGWPRDIGWHEFKEVSSRPAGEAKDAKINSELIQPERVRVTRQDGQFRLAAYTIKATVNRANSWVVTDRKSDKLKAHEQGHYDILGLHGRDMVADLAALRADSTAELQTAVTAIIERSEASAKKMNEQYETETKNGTEDKEQQRWETQIKDWTEKGTRVTTTT